MIWSRISVRSSSSCTCTWSDSRDLLVSVEGKRTCGDGSPVVLVVLGDGLVPGAGTRRWGVLCRGHLAVGLSHILSFTEVAQHAQRAGKEGRRKLGVKLLFRVTCSHGQVVLREMAMLSRNGETAFLLSPLCFHCFLPWVFSFCLAAAVRGARASRSRGRRQAGLLFVFPTHRFCGVIIWHHCPSPHGLVPGAGTRRWGVLCRGHLAVGLCHILSFTAVAQHAQRAGKEGRRKLGVKLVASDAEHLAEVLGGGAPFLSPSAPPSHKNQANSRQIAWALSAAPFSARLERLGRRRILVLVRVRQEAVEGWQCSRLRRDRRPSTPLW